MPQQAVIVTIAFGRGSPVDAADQYRELVDEIEQRLSRRRGMELDGTEVGEGTLTIYCYGSNADRLWGEIEPLFAARAFPPGSSALKRYGGPGAAGSRIELTPDGIGPAAAVPKERPAARNYAVGDWVLAPVDEGRFVVGRIARARGHSVFGYFFAPPVTGPPSDDELDRLRPAGAYTYLRFSDLGIRDGSWPVIKARKGFDRGQWPVAPFENYVDAGGGRVWLEVVTYDDDAIRQTSVTRVDVRQRGRFPDDMVSGSEAALEILRQRLPR
jgi:hypothetical protein